MQEIFRTSQPGQIAFVKSLLTEARIKYFVFGEDVIPGTTGAFAECRFMVLEDEAAEAAELLAKAGLFMEEELVDLMVTQDEEIAEEAQRLLDENEINSTIEEDRPDEGIIPGVGEAAVTYYLVVLEGDYTEASDVLEAAGMLEPLEKEGGNA